MSYSKLILRDSADIVWPLDDITESSSVSKAINFFNNNPNSFSASININATELVYNPIVFGGGTLLSFSSSTIGLSIPALGRFSEIYNGRDSSLSIWFQTNELSNTEQVIFKKRNFNNIGLFIKDNYLIFRYGTSASYVEVTQDFSDGYEPMHIFVGKNQSSIFISINGNLINKSLNDIELSKDINHINNDYLDFYGPKIGNWYIDTPTFYPNILNQSILKRHYVYGLGKNINDNIFYSRGGNLYNFSTIDTKKLSLINWRYPQEWNLFSLENLISNNDGIQTPKFNAPSLYSVDNNIITASNSIKFSSSSNTVASYIDITRLYSKWTTAENPLFIKVKLDGQLPDNYLTQRIMSYTVAPNYEIMNFDLLNNNGTYKILISTAGNTASTSFNINNITASPDIYIGMNFIGRSIFYFAESGYSIQTSSFSYLSASGYGLDPLTLYFPPSAESFIRIGSTTVFDESNYSNNVSGVKQFYGTFKRFFIARPDIELNQDFNYLENYNKSNYESQYDSSLQRFKVKSYGKGDFIIHTLNFSEYISDEEIKIGGNVVNFGYPFIQSSSQVLFYTTLIDYSGSVVYPKTRLLQNNYLPFLNNTNLQNKYLKFEFEIYADDVIFYPPKIKYFNMETYRAKNNKVSLLDDSGISYDLNQSSSTIFLPEIRQTPSIFMTKNSGLKLFKTTAEFSENILAKPLDPRNIEGLVLWIDARFINGLGKVNPIDDQKVLYWADLSDNTNNAVSSSTTAPVFRTQSLNILRMNQLTGADTDDLSFIISNNSNIEASAEGVVSGTRGIKITPDGNSTDSYIDVSFNTASITTFSNQSYTVVGSIKLPKPQTASSLYKDSRKIVVYNINNGSEIFAASSFAATNTRGIYSLSAVFTTSASTSGSRIRFYNGSQDPSDAVYWDNLGLYPISSGSAITSWVQPLTTFDRPTIKFDGVKTFFESSASISQPYSLYIVGRVFGDGTFISSTASSSFYSNSDSYYLNNGLVGQMLPSDNEFNVYSIIVDSSSARLYLNGDIISNKISVGPNNLSNLFIGKGDKMLGGDISAVVLFSGKHDYVTRTSIENWLDESFNLPEIIESITPDDDSYTAEYQSQY